MCFPRNRSSARSSTHAALCHAQPLTPLPPRVQSLSLLAQLLMETFLGHEALLFKYIHSAARLMTIMNLLRAKSRSIQFEAFHVFKVFVANPRKPDVVTGILISNRDKLLRFLTLFLQERGARRLRGCLALLCGLIWRQPFAPAVLT